MRARRRRTTGRRTSTRAPYHRWFEELTRLARDQAGSKYLELPKSNLIVVICQGKLSYYHII